MRVVLRADVSGLGRRGDTCDVADGYARNYLVPAGLALASSPGAERQAEVMRRTTAVRDAQSRQDAEQIAARLSDVIITVLANASDAGHLYGSVGSADIAAAIETQVGAVIERQALILAGPIKDLGTHSVICRPHSSVEFEVTVSVAAA